MSRRAIIVLVVCIGAVGFVNLVALAIFGPSLWRAAAAKRQSAPTVAVAPPTPAQAVAGSTPEPTSSTTNPAATPAKPGTAPTPVVAHTPLPDGAVVQRQEVSTSGKIRIKYVRSKGNPVRQIVLESVANPADSTVFFEHQRNAWLVISPNDEWIALNNRPKPGESSLQLYQRTAPDSLKYEIPEDLQGDQKLETEVWRYYLETMGLPADTQREGVTIDATGWDDDSKKLSVSVAVTPSDPTDKVPPPWTCTVDVESKDVEMTPESAEALKQQESQAATGTQSEGQNTTAPSGGNESLPGSYPGEKFSATRERALEESEVATWGPANIRYAINEMYARRGADFHESKDIARQFSKFSWYHPRPEVSMEQIESEFSEVEKQNLQVLGKYRDAKQTGTVRHQRTRSRPGHTPNPGEKFLRSVLHGLGN